MNLFADLGIEIINHFFNSIKIKKGLDHLLIVGQAKREGLRDYIICFNVELNSVDDYDQSFANVVLKARLYLGPFLTSITKNPPKNNVQLLT